MKKDASVAVVLLALCGFPVLIAALAIWHGWILSVLWNWFIPPTFGVTALTIRQAIGISLVVNVFKGYKSTDKSKEKDSTWADMGCLFIAQLILLLVGYIVKHF